VDFSVKAEMRESYTSFRAEMRGFFNAIQIYFGVPTLPARVTGQPASKSVYEGVTVTFNALVSGTAPLTNQWRFNGADLNNQTAPQLTFTSAAPAMNVSASDMNV